MKNLVLVIILVISVRAEAQKNAVYTEYLGNGGLSSINYERHLFDSPSILLRIGVGVTTDNLANSRQVVSIPSTFHYLIDLNKNNFLDISTGVTYFDASNDVPIKGILKLYTGIGFRRNFGGNWFFRGHVSPYVKSLSRTVRLQFDPSLDYTCIGGGFGFPSPCTSPRYVDYLDDLRFGLGFSIGMRF